MAITLEKSADWHEQRRRGIGGSDAGIIAGYTWGGRNTAYHLWQIKTGQREPDDLSHDAKVRAGTLLEPVVVQMYRLEHPELTIFHRKEMTTSKTYPWAYAHLDFTVHQSGSEWIPGEIKCPTHDDGWGASGSTQIPDYYQPQVQHNLAVTGKPYMKVVVLISGWDLRSYDIARDQDYIDTLMENEAEFWAAVETGTEPRLYTANDVKARFPIAAEGRITATPEVADTIAAYANAKASQGQIEKEVAALADKLAAVFGEFNTIVDENNNTLATYNTIECSRVDNERMKVERPEIIDEYQTISRYRRLLITKHRT